MRIALKFESEKVIMFLLYQYFRVNFPHMIFFRIRRIDEFSSAQNVREKLTNLELTEWK